MSSPANSEDGRRSDLPQRRTLMFAVEGLTRTGAPVTVLLPRGCTIYVGVHRSQPLPEGTIAGTWQERTRPFMIIPNRRGVFILPPGVLPRLVSQQQGVLGGRHRTGPIRFFDPLASITREVMMRSATEEQPGLPPASFASIEALKTVEIELLARDAAAAAKQGCTPPECAVCQDELIVDFEPAAKKRRIGGGQEGEITSWTPEITVQQSEVDTRSTTTVATSAALVVKEMPCGHRFHGDCIKKWLRVNGSCPLCRYRMPEEDNSLAEKTTAAASN